MFVVLLIFAVGCGGGSKSDLRGEDVEWLFVQTAERVLLDNGVLELQGVDPITVFFSDRPERLAAHGLTSEFVTYWSTGGGRDNFREDPPNATLAVVSEESVNDIVLTLFNPRLVDNTLSYNVTVIEGVDQLIGGPASLFIDVIGMPLTPLSVAGVARRSARRSVRRADVYR
jgi:hypothetical protein